MFNSMAQRLKRRNLCAASTRKRAFTFIEIIIVVTIIVLVMGVIGINIRRAMISQRFRTEVAQLVETLRLAQDLMLILSKDTHVKVYSSPDGEGIEYRLEVEGGIPKEWNPILNRAQGLLSSTHYANFEKEDNFLQPPGVIDLRFQSNGSLMSKGELNLSTHEDPFTIEAERRSICFKGYPHAIESMAVINVPQRGAKWISCNTDKEQDFFQQLTLYTQEEILADQPPQQQQPNDQINQTQPSPAPTPSP